MDKSRIVRIICDILILVFFSFFVLFLTYFVNGSLEVCPTEEDHAKIRAAMSGLMLLSGVPCLVCVVVRVKCRKRR